MKTIISGQGRRKVKEFGILMLAFGATGPVGGWHPWHGSHELLRETLKPHFPSSHLPALSNPLPVWLVNSHFRIHSAHNWLSSRFWEFLSGLIFLLDFLSLLLKRVIFSSYFLNALHFLFLKQIYVSLVHGLRFWSKWSPFAVKRSFFSKSCSYTCLQV